MRTGVRKPRVAAWNVGPCADIRHQIDASRGRELAFCGALREGRSPRVGELAGCRVIRPAPAECMMPERLSEAVLRLASYCSRHTCGKRSLDRPVD